MTRGPAGRVAAILGVLRPIADEIVVAVDDRATAEVIAALGEVADRLVGYRYRHPVDRPLPWLHRQVSADWLLTIDDDEIPGSALVDALPSLVAAEDVTHYWLPRRWLYTDTARYLDERPWRPDYQLRLVLNDLRLLRFPDETHWPIAALGPGRYLELPLYHADCLLNSLEARERKARHYEALLPGKRLAGRPLNAAYYLPERLPAPRTAPVPEADVRLIDRVLAAPDPESTERGEPLVAAPQKEVDRFWEGRSLAASAYRARIEVLEPLERMSAGEVRTLDVRVENLGNAIWPWGRESRPEIRLSCGWRAAEGTRLPDSELRTPMPADLHPGQACLVPLALRAPREPGLHTMTIDLLHEHVRWFGCEVKLQVEVQRQRRVALVSPPEQDLPLLSDIEPDFDPVVLVPEPEQLRGLYAGPTAPSADPYMLEGLPQGRTAAVLLAVRSLRLLASAWARRSGRQLRLPREGDLFLDALAEVDLMLLWARPRGMLRDRWVARTTWWAAKVLGVRTGLGSP